MKTITTANGVNVSVDDKDFELLSRFNWYAYTYENGHVQIRSEISMGALLISNTPDEK